jgi:RIO kinase 1
VLQHEPERAAPAWLNAGDTEDEVLGLLKTGKEAEVFVVERRTLDGRHSAILAHKRYRPTKVGKGELEALGFSRARSFTNDAMYHEGKKFRRSRERRAVERMTDLGKRILADRWPAQELETLVTAYEAGVTSPTPSSSPATGCSCRCSATTAWPPRGWSAPGSTTPS